MGGGRGVGRVFTRALHGGKLKSPLFPDPGGCVADAGCRPTIIPRSRGHRGLKL